MQALSEYEKSMCLTLWQDGESIISIAKMLPYKVGTAKRLIKDLVASGYLPQRKRGDLVKDRLKRLVASGVTDSYEIATILGINQQTVLNYKSRLKLYTERPPKNYRPTVLSEKTQQIIADLQNGISNKEIQTKYDVSRQYVSKVQKNYCKE